jgi:hypothetical protein
MEYYGNVPNTAAGGTSEEALAESRSIVRVDVCKAILRRGNSDNV